MKYLLYILGLVLLTSQCAKNPVAPEAFVATEAPETSPTVTISHVTALAVYSQDSSDTYPFPDEDLRQRIYHRTSEYFRTMSYGQLDLVFKEITDNGGYFRTLNAIDTYKGRYAMADENTKELFDGPYAFYNRDVLMQVVEKSGAEVFEDIDVIFLIGTDGGPGWYVQNLNAQGFAKLGFDFRIGDKNWTSQYGGVTIEIGSSFNSKLYNENELYWLFAHEYGHNLGMRNHRAPNLGIYSLLTAKLYSNLNMLEKQLGPSPLDPFLLMKFRWLDRTDTSRVIRLDPITLKNGAIDITINQIRSMTGHVVLRIPVDGTESQNGQGGTSECFYVTYHNRDNNIFDAVYVNSGLLVWHTINDGIIDVECGQSLQGKPDQDHLDINLDTGGQPTDFYNQTNGQEFTPFTAPNSSIWGMYRQDLRGKPSGIAITDIRDDGDQVTFRVSLEDMNHN